MEVNLISTRPERAAPARGGLWLSRPAILLPGRTYLRCNTDAAANTSTLTRVKLVDYDACAAFVIVRNPGGDRLRCPRDELFETQDRIVGVPTNNDARLDNFGGGDM